MAMTAVDGAIVKRHWLATTGLDMHVYIDMCTSTGVVLRKPGKSFHQFIIQTTKYASKASRYRTPKKKPSFYNKR